MVFFIGNFTSNKVNKSLCDTLKRRGGRRNDIKGGGGVEGAKWKVFEPKIIIFLFVVLGLGKMVLKFHIHYYFNRRYGRNHLIFNCWLRSYDNPCFANCSGASVACPGKCPCKSKLYFYETLPVSPPPLPPTWPHWIIQSSQTCVQRSPLRLL